MVVVLSGPGGVGKGTIAERLVASDPRLWLSRSWTTRPRRSGEPEDAYVFVDRASFERHRDRGGFLEWNEYLGHLYGTPMPDAPPDRDLLLEIDVNGARQVREQVPGALLLFVDAPSREHQRRRLIGRGDDPESVERRLAQAEEEVALASDLDCPVVVNDDLERAVEEVRDLIDAHRRVTGELRERR